MSARKSNKVIFDTNIGISFLIGKRLQTIKGLIISEKIIIVLSQLLLELKIVTARRKMKKYFSEQRVEELILFLRAVGQIYDPTSRNQSSRDPKDNFLLDLAEISKADFLVTGDKDLLVLNPFKKTHIIAPAEFEMKMTKA